MYRIQDSDGEEQTFGSREEFTAAVVAGEIGADALIYHATTDRWILVCLNPDYLHARNEIRPVGELEAPWQSDGEKPFWQTVADVAAKSPIPPEPPPLRDRMLRWGTVAAGVVILSGVGVTFWVRGPSDSTDMNAPSTAAAHDVALRSPASQAPETVLDSNPETATPVIRLAATADTTALWNQPLASTRLSGSASESGRPYTVGMGAAATRMNQDLESIGWEQVFTSTHLGAMDQVRAGRRVLEAAQNVFESYRVEARRLLEEDRQDTVHLARGPGGPLPESYAMEQVADSLTGQVDRVMNFLLEQQGSYVLTRRGIEFDHPEDAQRFASLRARIDTLIAEGVAAARAEHRPLAPPMRAILSAIDSLPRVTAP